MTSFSTGIPKEWRNALEARNALDALDFLESVIEKLTYTTWDYNSYFYVMEQRDKSYSEWNKELFEKKRISHSPSETIDYFSTPVSAQQLIRKISYNFFNASHSLFDHYAHFLHASLYPNEPIEEELYFMGMYHKINKDTKYKQISSAIKKYINIKEFWYINDIDNIGKHKGLISPETITWLNDGQQDSSIRGFKKKYKDGKRKREHDKKEMGSILSICWELCVNFYNEVTGEVFNCIK